MVRQPVAARPDCRAGRIGTGNEGAKRKADVKTQAIIAEMQPGRPQRARGVGRLRTKASAGRTRLDTFYQEGCAKIRLPETFEAGMEAVLINTSGGLKSKGHPVGASGAAQAVEVWKQMRGLAGNRQVDRDVDLAMTHNVGGTGQSCVVHIYERR